MRPSFLFGSANSHASWLIRRVPMQGSACSSFGGLSASQTFYEVRMAQKSSKFRQNSTGLYFAISTPAWKPEKVKVMPKITVDYLWETPYKNGFWTDSDLSLDFQVSVVSKWINA
jgi:hypothetical protein